MDSDGQSFKVEVEFDWTAEHCTACQYFGLQWQSVAANWSRQ